MFELVYLVIPGVSQLLVSPLLSVLPCLKFNDLLAAGHLSSSPSRWQPLAKVADNLLLQPFSFLIVRSLDLQPIVFSANWHFAY